MAEPEPTIENTEDSEKETRLDSGYNFEDNANNHEHENNNEYEAGIDGEKGEKSIEDENLEEKEETLSQFITANRECSEEFKLEYEGTFVLSTLTEEQKNVQADLLAALTANPEKAMMLPDYIEGKITYFTAVKMDNEGNLKYEIRSYTEEKEEKEEKPINEVGEAKVEEATLNLKLNIDIDKQEEVNNETILNQSSLAENEAVSEEKVGQAEEIIQAKEQDLNIPEVNYVDIEQIISVEKTQPEPIFSEKNVNIDNTHYSEPLTIEAKEEADKVITERIIDLLKEESQAEFVKEANTVINEAKTEQTFKDIRKHIEPFVVMVEDRIEKAQTIEDRIIELLRDENEPIEIIFEQAQTSKVENIQQEQVVINTMDLENQAEVKETIQASHIESIQEQNIEPVEQVFTSEKIGVAIVKEKPEGVILVNEKEGKVSNTRENKVATKEATPEKIQVLNTKPEKETKDNVLPFKTRESEPDAKSVEVKAIKPVTEKAKIVKEINRLPDTAKEKIAAKNEQEKTSKNIREAIVLNFNRNTINNTIRNEAQISLKQKIEAKRTTEERLKAKPLNDHQILLHILGIFQNTKESRNGQPTNSRSVSSINQEEQETKSTKSISSIYQKKNLNGITLKIAA